MLAAGANRETDPPGRPHDSKVCVLRERDELAGLSGVLLTLLLTVLSMRVWRANAEILGVDRTGEAMARSDCWCCCCIIARAVPSAAGGNSAGNPASGLPPTTTAGSGELGKLPGTGDMPPGGGGEVTGAGEDPDGVFVLKLPRRTKLRGGIPLGMPEASGDDSMLAALVCGGGNPAADAAKAAANMLPPCGDVASAAAAGHPSSIGIVERLLNCGMRGATGVPLPPGVVAAGTVLELEVPPAGVLLGDSPAVLTVTPVLPWLLAACGGCCKTGACFCC